MIELCQATPRHYKFPNLFVTTHNIHDNLLFSATSLGAPYHRHGAHATWTRVSGTSKHTHRTHTHTHIRIHATPMCVARRISFIEYEHKMYNVRWKIRNEVSCRKFAYITCRDRELRSHSLRCEGWKSVSVEFVIFFSFLFSFLWARLFACYCCSQNRK